MNGQQMAKRSLDVFLVAHLFFVFAIPAVLIALAIRLTSKGPILHWSNRVGKNNRRFRMPKFRTMRVDTPQVATHLLVDREDYVTRIGHFLRTTSLDELPQLWSILVGDMSFVGPRPALYNQHDLIDLRTELGLHRISPGLTGWAQVNGRDELTIQEKVACDYHYASHQSLGFDAYIVILTLKKVLARESISDNSSHKNDDHALRQEEVTRKVA